MQVTLALIGENDVLKVIDQGSDDSVNAVNIKKLVTKTTGVQTTTRTQDATLVQSRHRIPEVPLRADQVLVLQVPEPEPLRDIERSEFKTKRYHAEKEYSGAYLMLFEQIMRYNQTSQGADYPVLVNGRYVMNPSPIPRFDNPKIHQSEALILFGAGREKKFTQSHLIQMWSRWHLKTIRLLSSNLKERCAGKQVCQMFFSMS